MGSVIGNIYTTYITLNDPAVGGFNEWIAEVSNDGGEGASLVERELKLACIILNFSELKRILRSSSKEQ